MNVRTRTGRDQFAVAVDVELEHGVLLELVKQDDRLELWGIRIEGQLFGRSGRKDPIPEGPFAEAVRAEYREREAAQAAENGGVGEPHVDNEGHEVHDAGGPTEQIVGTPENGGSS